MYYYDPFCLWESHSNRTTCHAINTGSIVRIRQASIVHTRNDAHESNVSAGVERQARTDIIDEGICAIENDFLLNAAIRDVIQRGTHQNSLPGTMDFELTRDTSLDKLEQKF